ncbi:hypothetical protein VFPFJ_08123 [Purpureocillium lilacinum]|uniref:Uncharacterized protein n=1 Tax=Purpureocillium lilacinum TaxID=33203 RepID=A0A179H6E7_PURLI|nr:hypothetical protein VFPFJ_08123 [Purpureocillium lilacinum]OAQ85734.1 hypothetical protein VFPFJ_08123 [Purpureocillium lilacinum]
MWLAFVCLRRRQFASFVTPPFDGVSVNLLREVCTWLCLKPRNPPVLAARLEHAHREVKWSHQLRALGSVPSASVRQQTRDGLAATKAPGPVRRRAPFQTCSARWSSQPFLPIDGASKVSLEFGNTANAEVLLLEGCQNTGDDVHSGPFSTRAHGWVANNATAATVLRTGNGRGVCFVCNTAAVVWPDDMGRRQRTALSSHLLPRKFSG